MFRKVISFGLLLLILASFFFQDFLSSLRSPFLTDGVSTLKDYFHFSKRDEFQSACWVQSGSSIFSGGIIDYVQKNDKIYAVILTSGHGFQHLLNDILQNSHVFDDASLQTIPITPVQPGSCQMGLGDYSHYLVKDGAMRALSGNKLFSISHVIFNPFYVSLIDDDSSVLRAHDYALAIAEVTSDTPLVYPAMRVPLKPFSSIATAEFCGYGTHNHKKRALGLFGGEYRTLFPHHKKAILVYPFFDPKGLDHDDNDDLIEAWKSLDKIPTGRSEPGDSGACVLSRQNHNDPFYVVGVVQGVQFQGDLRALKKSTSQEQFDNVETIITPIMSQRKDGFYHASKVFKLMRDRAYRVIDNHKK